MAQSGFTPISLYFSATSAAVPTAGNLVAGELALNTNDGKLYFKNSSGVVTLLAGSTSGPAGGSTTQVQYNNAGVLAGITGATTNGTALTLVAPNLGSPASVGTMPAFTLGGTVSGGGNQLNNVVIGTTTPLAGAFTTLSATGATTLSAALTYGGVTLTNAVTGTGKMVLDTSPTLVTPALGTPSALIGTNITGTAAGLTAGNVTTNANLTGAVTSVGNATSLGSFTSLQLLTALTDETGTGANVFATSPTLVTPALGAATATSLVSSGTAASSFTVTSGTAVPLTITNVGTGNSFVVEDSASTDSTPFVIDASGYVISGSTAALTDGSIQTFKLDGIGANDFARKNTAGSGIVLSGETVGNLRFYGFDGTSYIRTAQIFSAVDGTPGTNDMPGRLAFSTTADGASTPTERMRIDSAGSVGIGATSLTGYSLKVGKSITGATNSYGIASDAQVQSDVTASANYFASVATTQATAFTLSILRHYWAFQNAFGAGSTVTDQYGFAAQSNLTGATNNYGFYSNIASTANRYNFYANGTADNFFNGSVGIGGLPFAGATLYLGKNATGATAAYGVFNQQVVQSDVTSSYASYYNAAYTQAAAFTLTDYYHYRATQGTIGATSAITNQYGFRVESALTGATNNYGFYSNIASTANRYNFYANGTADNYFAGSVGIGGVPVTGTKVVLSGSATGSTTVYGILNQQSIQSDVTANAVFFGTSAFTAASVSLTNLFHYSASQATFSGTVVNNQYGYRASSAFTGGTNNYGFYGDIASGTNRWNFYANGTARNYMAADLTVNGATAIPAGGTAGAGLMVSTTANFGVFFGSGAPTLTAAKGSLYLRSDGSTTNDRMYVNTNGSTTWTNVVTSA